jgi:hypothetical protein
MTKLHSDKRFTSWKVVASLLKSKGGIGLTLLAMYNLEVLE